MRHFKKIISVLACLAVFSCTKEQQGESGRVSFQVVSSQSLTEQTKSDESGSVSGPKVSDYTTLPQASDFELSVVNVSSDEEVWSGKVTEWSDEMLLSAGTYKVTASYGNVEEEGFDKPFFTTGSKGDEELPNPVQFAIVGGEEPVEVTVPVILGNTLIKFECSKSFNNYYKDYTFKLVRGEDELAVFTKEEHIDVEKPKAAFVDSSYKFEIKGLFTSVSGVQVEYTGEKEISNLDPATIYTVKVDVVNVGGLNKPTIEIEFDENLILENLGDVELNEDDQEE